MAKKTKQNQIMLTNEESSALQNAYITELDTKPEYSLDADPEDKYKLTDAQKMFIVQYVQYRSVGTAAELAKMSLDSATEFFNSYSCQQEIRRINRALYQRQFAKKLISIDDIGGFLSSLLTGEDVPIVDRLETKDKLRVVELLIRLNELKAGMSDPRELQSMDISVQIKELSITTLQQLLYQNNVMKQKQELIASVDNGLFTPEEKDYLKSLPTEELLKLLDKTNKTNKEDDNNEA